MVSGGTPDLTPYLALIFTLICILSITVFGAILGWGLEILRRRQVTLLILFGMTVACAFLSLFILRVPIQQQLKAVNRMEPIPTIQATAVPLPTDQLPRGSRGNN